SARMSCAFISSSTVAANSATPFRSARGVLRGRFAAVFFGAVVFFAAVGFFAAAVFFRTAFFFAVGALPAAPLACSLPCSFAFAALRGARRFTALLTVFGITPRFHDDVANGFRHQKARIAARAHRAPQSAR